MEIVEINDDDDTSLDDEDQGLIRIDSLILFALAFFSLFLALSLSLCIAAL